MLQISRYVVWAALDFEKYFVKPSSFFGTSVKLFWLGAYESHTGYTDVHQANNIIILDDKAHRAQISIRLLNHGKSWCNFKENAR